MSLSWLLLECSYAFGKSLEDRTSGEPALYGRAFHDLLPLHFQGRLKGKRASAAVAAARKKHDVSNPNLEAHVLAAYTTLKSWMGRNEYRIDFEAELQKGHYSLLLEKAVALKPLEQGRFIAPHDENHRYQVEEGEQPGTLDWALIPSKKYADRLPLVLLDHKTGDSEDFSRPLEKAQLLSLVAALLRIHNLKKGIVGVLHARRWGMPKVYSERVELGQLKQYEGRIKSGLEKIGSGQLRPGSWCARCPAQTVCPARDADLLGRAGDVLTGLTAAGGALSSKGLLATDLAPLRVETGSNLTLEQKLGQLYSIAKLGENLIERVRAEIKAALLNNPNLLPVTPTGEYLIIRRYEKESVSKSSIIEAYGKRLGEKKLEQLRKDGAVHRSEVVQLWPEKERGK